MIDIDHFKNVNDNYGHDIGDLVLIKIAEKAEQSAVSAKACRWGGEEFVLWFPTGGGDPEAIRLAIEQMKISFPKCDKTVSVTASIGAAKGDGDLLGLISRADKALYKAKKNGRNRVEWELSGKR